MPTLIIVLLLGYTVGSLPLANIVARRRGAVDLRDVGDHNPGYWNAREVLGRRAARVVLLGDLAKGTAPAALAVAFADGDAWWPAYAATGAAMVGHAYPVFARFRGGRSVLTFIGGALVYAPAPALISVALGLAVGLVGRTFAWGVRAGVIAFPFVQIALEGPWRTAATGVLMSFIGFRFAVAGRENRQE